MEEIVTVGGIVFLVTIFGSCLGIFLLNVQTR